MGRGGCSSGCLIGLRGGWPPSGRIVEVENPCPRRTAPLWPEQVLRDLLHKLMVRFLTVQGVALCMWANLTWIQGTVVRTVENGYMLRTNRHHTPPEELLLEIAEGATFNAEKERAKKEADIADRLDPEGAIFIQSGGPVRQYELFSL